MLRPCGIAEKSRQLRPAARRKHIFGDISRCAGVARQHVSQTCSILLNMQLKELFRTKVLRKQRRIPSVSQQRQEVKNVPRKNFERNNLGGVFEFVMSDLT